MSNAPEIIALYEEFYKLEEKIALLYNQMAELSRRYEDEIGRLNKELEAQKNYYSGHIKELYRRNQIPVR